MPAVSVLDVDANDVMWQRALNSVGHDVYHLPQYAEVSSLPDGGTPRAIVASAESTVLLLPYIRRDIDDDLWDATSPYGYASPTWTAGADASVVGELLRSAMSQLSREGCVSLFLRGHPGSESAFSAVLEEIAVTSTKSTTVLINLKESPEEMWSGTTSGHRSQINRSRRNGYEEFWDVDFDWYPSFIDSYLRDMQRLGAREYYHFDQGYFSSLQTHLGGHLKLGVSTYQGEFAAACLFLTSDNWTHYHLATTAAAHREQSPGKALIDFARRSLADEGYQWLHLGGGRGGGEDSVHRFKAGFGGSQATFVTYGIVLNKEVYVNLSSSALPTTDFFPAYRSPTISLKESHR